MERTQSDTAFAVRLGESKGCLNPTHGCCLKCPLRFAVLVAPLGTNRGAPAILMLRPPQVKKNQGPRFFLIALTMALYNPASRRADSLNEHAVAPLQRGSGLYFCGKVREVDGGVDFEGYGNRSMKFGEKYELLESLTTGGVETFVANDKVRGERVLVHILECDAQKPNQSTVQWVLEAFRRIAPEPAALVLETGRYSGTLYAYVVTRMPDDAALRKWVKLYKAQASDTQEIPAPPAKATPQSESPTAEMTSKLPPLTPSRAPAPVSVTDLFRDSGSNAKAETPNAPSKEAFPPLPPLPTAQSTSDRSSVRPATDFDAFPPRVPVPEPKPAESSFSNSAFSSAFRAPKLPSETNPPPPHDKSRPGEFTSFFQGPFRVEGPPQETPVASQRFEPPPQKPVGDFTAMFNPPRSDEPSPTPGVAGNEPAGTGFTGFFSNPNLASRTSGTAGAPPSGGLPRSVMDDSPVFPAPRPEPYVPPQPASYVAPAPPIASIPTPIFAAPPLPNPMIEPPVMPSSSSAPEAATNAFNRSVREPAPGPPPPPSGPSPYTQVISLRPLGSQKQASPSSPPTPGFPAPSAPSVPAIAMPPAPPMPKVAAPAAPKAPAAAKVEVAAPAVSYWPLILTLTVLFFIAVLLVLYFALRH